MRRNRMVEVGEYTVKQEKDGDVWVRKGKKVVSHAQARKQMSDAELVQLVSVLQRVKPPPRKIKTKQKRKTSRSPK